MGVDVMHYRVAELNEKEFQAVKKVEAIMEEETGKKYVMIAGEKASDVSPYIITCIGEKINSDEKIILFLTFYINRTSLRRRIEAWQCVNMVSCIQPFC